MARADSNNIEICEMRLKRNGFRYLIMYGPQVLISGHGERLALDEIVSFVDRAR